MSAGSWLSGWLGARGKTTRWPVAFASAGGTASDAASASTSNREELDKMGNTADVRVCRLMLRSSVAGGKC